MGGSGRTCLEEGRGGGGRCETPIPITRETCLDEGRDGGGGRLGDLILLLCAGESTLRGGGTTDEGSASRGGANAVLEIIGDGGKGGVCVDEGVDPKPETCRLVFVSRIGGSYAFEVFVLNDSAVTLGGTGIGGAGGLG